jgi:hypothetical protein
MNKGLTGNCFKCPVKSVRKAQAAVRRSYETVEIPFKKEKCFKIETFSLKSSASSNSLSAVHIEPSKYLS